MSPFVRRLSLRCLVLSLLLCGASSVAAAEMVWIDLHQLGVEGQAWKEVKAPYDRLPAKAEGVVRDPVWSLSRHSAGMAARFVTDATEIHARWTLTSPNLAMSHMPATGVSGVDLYVRTDEGWRWLAVGRPSAQTNSVTLVSGLSPGVREYLLYLPLYNGVSSVEVGVPAANVIKKAPPRPKHLAKPILFWGTSITHGACASRPGTTHSAILGRRFDRPIINLGFSGNGKMEPEVAQLAAELDPAVYVIDCLPNMNASEVEQRVEGLVEILRKAHPTTPIVLAEDRTYANAFLIPSKAERNATSRVALRAGFERLQKKGVKHLYYLPGDTQLGADGDDTVDSSHPNDLGFMRMADAFDKVLRPLLAP
ncbi:SGNH/GDSL hydrolase family protein [Lignipirellula cremea]|uniref:SGNH hydrolase-type esterase domain-containing protein n=1 Tax=Lignipirellula cremea TaxID=2528010 RepID=A0A518DP91_9BACT|nr:SGNH/GDSL hydrolase family protein [Lignipirellula cremea]QDU93652.1 hypothetical protein Pla8534_14330 [Lignipirellula cremea]